VLTRKLLQLLELKVSVKALGDVLDAPSDGRESAEVVFDDCPLLC